MYTVTISRIREVNRGAAMSLRRLETIAKSLNLDFEESFHTVRLYDAKNHLKIKAKKTSELNTTDNLQSDYVIF